MTPNLDRPAAGPFPDIDEALARVSAYLGTAPADSLDRLGWTDEAALTRVDLSVVLKAARTVADVRAHLAHRERTGLLLAGTRSELRNAVGKLAAVESAATRHHRGDPHGPQGAAAKEILELLGATTVTAPVDDDDPADWSRLDEAAVASAQMIAWHAPKTAAALQAMDASDVADQVAA